MNVYLETSVIVRQLVDQPQPIRDWGAWGRAFTSALTRVEGMRALDRLRLEGRFDDAEIAAKRAELGEMLTAFDSVAIGPAVLARAAQPFATAVRTLDAVHLATAQLAEDELEGELVFLTHDRRLGIAARALGFDVRGVAL